MALTLQSMLLASLILLLYWTPSSVESHDPANFSPHFRVKRDLAPDSKDQADKILNTVKDSLSLFKDVMETIDTDKVANVMKGLASFASMAPGIGGLVSSVINMVLIFIPQDDEVLIEVKAGFANVNRKLDSLSIQLSSLATDVEWFNYASVYSQDEVRILNAWKKFNEFRENSGLVQSQEEKLRLAEIFTNYYEYTGTEASVANFYHYMTVSGTSLSGNINDLLRKKFECDISKIGKYNLHFSSLLWKGMVLNQLYWNLIGFNKAGIEAKHTKMFDDVYNVQLSAVEFCLNNYNEYMKKDVVRISKEISHDNKPAIAETVKKNLDAKYSWYLWEVLVYDTDQEKNIMVLDMMKIPVDAITVAVGHTVKGDESDVEELKELANSCLEGKDCTNTQQIVSACAKDYNRIYLPNYVKVTHATYGEDFAHFPPPFHQVECQWRGYASKISMYFSHRDLSICEGDKCKNGRCETLLDSNEFMCSCQDGYYGNTCESQSDTSKAPLIDTYQPVPDISTINYKLKMIESKLENILSTISERCPAQ